MGWLRRLRNTLSSGTDGDIDEELRFHIDARTDEYLCLGMTHEQAQQAALTRFGNRAAIKEQTHRFHTFPRLSRVVLGLKTGLVSGRLATIGLAAMVAVTSVGILSLRLSHVPAASTMATQGSPDRWRGGSCGFAIFAREMLLAELEINEESKRDCPGDLARIAVGDVAKHVTLRRDW